jgi:hypothetical protein
MLVIVGHLRADCHVPEMVWASGRGIRLLSALRLLTPGCKEYIRELDIVERDTPCDHKDGRRSSTLVH